MTNKTKPHRRWFLQFSLRTALVLMTVLAVGLGTWLERGRRQKAAVEALLQAKGYVRLVGDFQWDGMSKRIVNPSVSAPDWANGWLDDHCFMQVDGVVAGYAAGDELLVHAAQLPHLTRLANDVEMVFTIIEDRSDWSAPCNYATKEGRGFQPVSDSGLRHLRGSKRLEYLTLIGTEVTDDGLRYLARLQRLKALKISSPNITDKGIPHFLRLKNLEDLCVSGTSISEVGLAELRRGLPNCDVVGPPTAEPPPTVVEPRTNPYNAEYVRQPPIDATPPQGAEDRERGDAQRYRR